MNLEDMQETSHLRQKIIQNIIDPKQDDYDLEFKIKCKIQKDIEYSNAELLDSDNERGEHYDIYSFIQLFIEQISFLIDFCSKYSPSS